MNKLTLLITIAMSLLMTACSSTQTAQVEPVQVEKNEFKPLNKKPLTSDYHLLASLLNRPVTPDQQLMLNFAASRDKFKQDNPWFVSYVSIRGSKQDDPMTYTPPTETQQLIAQDSHAISLIGPQ